MENTPTYKPISENPQPKTKVEQLIHDAFMLKLQMYQVTCPDEINECLELLKAKNIEIALTFDPIDESNILDALYKVDSDFRWEVFETIFDKYELSPKAYNIALKFAWTTGVGTGAALPYFLKADGRLMMNDKELEYFNNLPNTITIYRGCSADELEDEDSHLGISWTTSMEIAEFFAFRNETDENRMVVSITVPKSDIVAFINNREEYECIYLAADEDKIQIVTEEPTDLFYDYMERKEEQDQLLFSMIYSKFRLINK